MSNDFGLPYGVPAFANAPNCVGFWTIGTMTFIGSYERPSWWHRLWVRFFMGITWTDGCLVPSGSYRCVIGIGLEDDPTKTVAFPRSEVA